MDLQEGGWGGGHHGLQAGGVEGVQALSQGAAGGALYNGHEISGEPLKKN